MGVRARSAAWVFVIVALFTVERADAQKPSSGPGSNLARGTPPVHDKRQVNAQVEQVREEGPPPNLDAGKFQRIVDSMWRYSGSFRAQCLRLAAAPRLRVTITADVFRPPSYARSQTSMFRQRGVLITADIVLHSLADSVELIAHEVEHVIEQLEGVELHSKECKGSTSPSGFYESCRALEMGRRVAQEVQQRSLAGTSIP